MNISNPLTKSPLLGVQGHGREIDDAQSCGEKGLPFPTKIVIRKGAIIDQIAFGYSNGNMYKHGGNGGGETSFSLSEGEYLIKIEGNSQSFNGQMIIENLAFQTNKGRTLAKDTPRGSNHFEFTAKPGEAICCLYSYSDKFLGRIGVYTRKIEQDTSAGMPKTPDMPKNPEIPKMPDMTKLGL